jgi:uncharacterized RDD family membrane protein YckC
MEWYYATGHQQHGPVSDEELAQLVAAGTVKTDTLVWHAGMEDWVPHGSLQQVAAAPGTADDAPRTGVCTECGKLFPKQDLLAYHDAAVCAACKPVFFQRLQEGAATPGVLQYAGFWIRCAAKIIDTLILMAASWVVSMLLLTPLFRLTGNDVGAGGLVARQVAVQSVAIAIHIAYTVFFLGRFGATPGKMACRLKVVRSNSDPLTYWRAFGRYWGDRLSATLLCIGYLVAAFDEEKRTLHDHICDTRVIKTE